MLKLSPEEKIQIFKDLFKGREEIFAVRWEKSDKSASGYTPVCLNEWKVGLCLKLKRRKCRYCQNKRYASLNEYYIEQHLRGYKAYGIYPLLDDNSSYFLAADFDGEKWENDCLKFINKCAEYNLHASLEKSRSGKGEHVWLFFSSNHPAFKSRKIAFTILQQACIIDEFEKQDSFDRLFPNHRIH